MKSFFPGAAVLVTVLASCNNSSSGSSTTAGKPASILSVVASDYLKMKNAFAADDDKEAATMGNEMVKAMDKIDTTGMTPEQSKVLGDVRDDVREHAEHIGKNAGNIKHQREHFDMMSKDMIQLVKAFGPGQQLYVEHCPMYNNNKGADWLSEIREIKNPYLGQSMPTCGTVKEELK